MYLLPSWWPRTGSRGCRAGVSGKVIAMKELGLLLLGTLFGWLLNFWADRRQRLELFDHRLRIEKEYQIYVDLWDKLFDFKIAAHDLVETLQIGAPEDPQGDYIKTFNAFNRAVCRHEPFIHPNVYEPSRTILRQGRAIIWSSQELTELQKRREHARDLTEDERVADKLIAEDQTQQVAMDGIDKEIPEVCSAIRGRIGPRLGRSDQGGSLKGSRK